MTCVIEYEEGETYCSVTECKFDGDEDAEEQPDAATVTIPATFNGKPVRILKGKIFTEEDVEKVKRGIVPASVTVHGA